MEFDPHDQDIVGLLTKLKNAEDGYPADLLAARRQNYLNQMAQAGLGAGLATGLTESAKNAGTSTVPPAASTLLEAALVVAIIVEAGAVAYFYRDRIADFFQGKTIEPRVQEIVPVLPTVPELQESTFTVVPSAVVTATIPSTLAPATASTTPIPITVTSTAIPGVADEINPTMNNTSNTTSSGAAVNQPDSTPAPNGDNDNPGNHYGQTPKPERTKESGNNDTGNSDPGNNDTSSDNNSNNDDTPAETNNEQAPRDNPKPTKTK